MQNGRNSVTISSILQLLLFAVIAHLGEDGGDERLETGFCFLADGGLWDAGVFLDETVGYLNGLVVELRGSISPGFA